MAQVFVGQFTSQHMTVSVKDGTGTPLTAILGPGPGDMTFGSLEEGNKAATKVLNRGSFQELVYGEDNEVPFSITCHMVGDQTGESVTDALLKTGNFASAVTMDPGGLVYTLDILVSGTRGAVTNTYTLNNCRTVAKFTESKEGNTWSFSGTCYQGITVG